MKSLNPPPPPASKRRSLPTAFGLYLLSSPKSMAWFLKLGTILFVPVAVADDALAPVTGLLTLLDDVTIPMAALFLFQAYRGAQALRNSESRLNR